MTPTLAGRWQTRIALMTTTGGLISLIFGSLYANFRAPFILLGLALLLGLIWDVIYHSLQNFRWDGDWPPLFYFLGCTLEGVVLWLLSSQILRLDMTLAQFTAHYAAIWLTTFAIMFGPLKILFPRWRFRGGEFRGR